MGSFDINASAENQTFLIDGVGTQAYSYDQLSRLTSETRTFTGVGSFTDSTYYLRSSVLGNAIVEELGGNGAKNVGYVYSSSGAELANQSGGIVNWKHNTPAGTGQYTVNSYNSATTRTEFDPLGADVSLNAPSSAPPNEGDGDIGAGHLGGIMDARWSDMFNLSSGCSARGVASSCSGQVAMFNLQAAERAFFGYRWYDLPGNANNREQGEMRYDAMLQNDGKNFGMTGLDPAFGRYWGNYGVDNGKGQAEAGYGPDISFTDQGTHDVTVPYNVTVTGGAEYIGLMQGAGPITVRYMDKKYVNDFVKTLGEAERRLQKADCAKLFGKSSAELVQMLENTEYRVLALASGGPKYDSNTGEVSVAAAQTNLPSTTSVFINSKGPFFNNRMVVAGRSGVQTLDLNTGLVGVQFGALLLLHELGHQVGIFGPDAGNEKLNRQYTDRVRKACF